MRLECGEGKSTEEEEDEARVAIDCQSVTTDCVRIENQQFLVQDKEIEKITIFYLFNVN